MGFANYFRRFIPQFSGIAEPLHRLQHKDAAYDWTDACETAFRKIVELLQNPAMMVIPGPSDKLVIECDASGTALGAALYIESTTGRRSDRQPVAFASRTLTDVERRYSNTDREGLAVVWSVQTFERYVFKQDFVVETDHSALLPLFKRGDLKGRFARWVYALQDYDIRLVHVPGKSQIVADALSRVPLDGSDPTAFDEADAETYFNAPYPRRYRKAHSRSPAALWALGQSQAKDVLYFLEPQILASLVAGSTTTFTDTLSPGAAERLWVCSPRKFRSHHPRPSSGTPVINSGHDLPSRRHPQTPHPCHLA